MAEKSGLENSPEQARYRACVIYGRHHSYSESVLLTCPVTGRVVNERGTAVHVDLRRGAAQGAWGTSTPGATGNGFGEATGNVCVWAKHGE